MSFGRVSGCKEPLDTRPELQTGMRLYFWSIRRITTVEFCGSGILITVTATQARRSVTLTAPPEPRLRTVMVGGNLKLIPQARKRLGLMLLSLAREAGLGLYVRLSSRLFSSI